MRTLYHLFLPCSLLSIATAVNALAGQTTLYDNLDILEGWVRNEENVQGPSITANGPDRIWAQHFVLGDRTAINEVTVQLEQVGTSVSGSMSFELWRGSEAGKPMLPSMDNAQVAELGVIPDVAQVPGKRTNYTFDTLVTGLSPNEEYWIVANHSNLQNIRGGSDSIGWVISAWPTQPKDIVGPIPPEIEAAKGSNGTSGSARGHAYRSGNADWDNLAGVFGLEEWYFVMSVQSPDLLGDFDQSGALDVGDIDLLSARVLTTPTDRSVDLNNDTVLTELDRDIWVRDLAGTQFGDTNFDGAVTFEDFLSLSHHFGQQGGWKEGDFNGDGKVTFPDFVILASNFENSMVAAVPEPTNVWIVIIGMLGVLRSRRG